MLLPASPEPRPLWTVGHSNHSLDHYLALLKSAEIDAVADVRSVPKSRYVPWFDRGTVGQALRGNGIQYVFLGRELGGRPEDVTCYDESGHVRYDAVASSALFESGVERLVAGMQRMRVAVMCAEEDPEHCHRRLLVARVLCRRGYPVRHIRRDGSVQDEPGFTNYTLLGEEELPWRSSASVSPRRQPSTSSHG